LRLFERLEHPALVGDAVFFFSERRHRWINVEKEALSKSSVMRCKQTGDDFVLAVDVASGLLCHR
jgi:hypothetical protein